MLWTGAQTEAPGFLLFLQFRKQVLTGEVALRQRQCPARLHPGKASPTAPGSFRITCSCRGHPEG